MCLGTACMCTFMLAQSCQLTGYKLRKKPTEDLCSGNKLLVLFFLNIIIRYRNLKWIYFILEVFSTTPLVVTIFVYQELMININILSQESFRDKIVAFYYYIAWMSNLYYI